MHFAWAVLVAYGIVRAGHRPWRWIAVAHPILTLIAITATANHYWLDAAVAGLLVVFGHLVLRPPADLGRTAEAAAQPA
jgi:hypothetical protein